MWVRGAAGRTTCRRRVSARRSNSAGGGIDLLDTTLQQWTMLNFPVNPLRPRHEVVRVLLKHAIKKSLQRWNSGANNSHSPPHHRSIAPRRTPQLSAGGDIIIARPTLSAGLLADTTDRRGSSIPRMTPRPPLLAACPRTDDRPTTTETGAARGG